MTPGPPRGLVRTPEGLVHRRLLPALPLRPYVAHVAWVGWDLTRPFVVQTLPHPTCHLGFGVGRARLHGVNTGVFVRRLTGEGRMIGIKLRPGMLAPLWPKSVATLTDRSVPLARLFGGEAAELEEAIADVSTLEAALGSVEAFLLPRLPPAPPEVMRMRDLVELCERDRSLCAVSDLAERSSSGIRTLERRCRAIVGVSPKWVIQRYRLHEAAAQLNEPRGPSLARLARELGYFDQAHFSRDFKRVVGCPPSALCASEAGRARAQRASSTPSSRKTAAPSRA